MKRLALAAVLAAAVAVAPGGTAARTIRVKVGDDAEGNLFFKPRRLTIRHGTRLKFTWVGELQHQVKGPGFKSKRRSAPYTYYVRFRRRGTRRLICTVHPFTMKMTVVVK